MSVVKLYAKPAVFLLFGSGWLAGAIAEWGDAAWWWTIVRLFAGPLALAIAVSEFRSAREVANR